MRRNKRSRLIETNPAITNDNVASYSGTRRPKLKEEGMDA